jgi:hypothetical protein
MYTHSTPEYIRYFKSLYSSKTLIVDEMGSGRSCGKFFKRFFSSDPSYICLVGVNKHVACILHGSSNRNLEKINFDLTGSLISYDANGPIRIAPEYKIEDVQPAHDCIDMCVHLLEHYRCDEPLSPKGERFLLHSSGIPAAPQTLRPSSRRPLPNNDILDPQLKSRTFCKKNIAEQKFSFGALPPSHEWLRFTALDDKKLLKELFTLLQNHKPALRQNFCSLHMKRVEKTR